MNIDKLHQLEKVVQQYAESENISFDETLTRLASLDVLTKYNLSARAFNSLYTGGIYTVRDLLSCTISNLKKLPSCGAGTIDELCALLERLGYIPVNKLCYGNIPLLFHRKGSGMFTSTDKMAVSHPSRLRPTYVYVTKNYHQISSYPSNLVDLTRKIWKDYKQFQ